jgi:hypothetical protein
LPEKFNLLKIHKKSLLTVLISFTCLCKTTGRLT